jgi:hypothetical protein
MDSFWKGVGHQAPSVSLSHAIAAQALAADARVHYSSITLPQETHVLHAPLSQTGANDQGGAGRLIGVNPGPVGSIA